MPDSIELRIDSGQMLDVFNQILVRNGFSHEDAFLCAKTFRDNSLDGVYTHGVNRFPRFIEYVQKGYVKPGNIPSLRKQAGSIEQWDGNLGPGPLNAIFATGQAIRLAKENGIGCVGLSNTNHWMRGGTYGWQAAQQGYILIAFTNTIANMPAWGALDRKLGNNPLVIAIPYRDEAIVLDMAMSQYSIGALNQAALREEQLPVDGGFDKDGRLTKDPNAILETGRVMATGYWKGAGLALLLDLLATLLSGGLSTAEISKKEAEYSVSQVFIALNLSQLSNTPSISLIIDSVINDYQQSKPSTDGKTLQYPGQRVLNTRRFNQQNGIPVIKTIWEEIMRLI